MAELTVFAEAGDGAIQGDGSSWDEAHDLTDGSSISSASTAMGTRISGGSTFRIWRGFFPFDTSALGASATVSAALLSIYVTAKPNNDNDGDDWVNVVQTTQPSTSVLATEDYDLCGSSVDDPTEGSVRKDITSDITNSQYNVWTLDATGRGWIIIEGNTLLGLREGHDALDNPLTVDGENGINVRFSEFTGTDSDPKLVITFTTNIDYDLPVTVGVFALTGIAAILFRGVTLAVTVGVFALTGIAVTFNKVLSMIASVGTFTLTGITAILIKAIKLTVTVGSFILTGISAVFSGTGSWKITNQAKSTAISPTNQSQNNISPTGQSKSSTVNFKNQEQS